MKTGDRLQKYFPWLPGVRVAVVIEKRTLQDGDYALASDGHVFRRVGTATLSARDKNREYWVVEMEEVKA